MLINNGDTLVVTKKVGNILKEGDIVKIVNVNEDNTISFVFGERFENFGVMTTNEIENYFRKVENKITAPKVTEERIEWIIDNSEINVQTLFGKCTVMSCKLPNGFVIVESSACVSPENYDEEMGYDICLNKIIDKVWELEGYRLQEEIFNSCDCDCDNCPCCEECYCEDDEDYDCPENPNNPDNPHYVH